MLAKPLGTSTEFQIVYVSVCGLSVSGSPPDRKFGVFRSAKGKQPLFIVQTGKGLKRIQQAVGARCLGRDRYRLFASINLPEQIVDERPGIAHVMVTHQLVTAVDVDVVLVAVMALAVFPVQRASQSFRRSLAAFPSTPLACHRP